MPEISAIPAIGFAAADRSRGGDLSALIAPPYDVLDERSKAALLAQDPHNIVAIDLPHLPPKTVGPDEAYARAGEAYRQWLAEGVLVRRGRPAVFVYQQTYEHAGQRFQRRGLIANVGVQPFGRSPHGKGGIHPHEQTFSEAKEDRLKLMRATRAQMSPIFGLYADPDEKVHRLLSAAIQRGRADFFGTTPDGVLHEAWAVEEEGEIRSFADALGGADIFIADGHHRYNTTLNYRRELEAAAAGGGARSGDAPPLPADHPANRCLFVLVSMQDPGMIVLPTHRVLGGMSGFTWDGFLTAAQRYFRVKPFPGRDLRELEAALGKTGQIVGTDRHAMGFYNPADAERPLWIATTAEPDPLRERFPEKSAAWRSLDVAMVQHLLVEGVCEPAFCGSGAVDSGASERSGGRSDLSDHAKRDAASLGRAKVSWKFPHTLDEFKAAAHDPGYQVGVLLRPTPLEAVRQVSAAGELMPQKSTFFYPKLATGMVINPLE